MAVIKIKESPTIKDEIDDINRYPKYVKEFVDIMNKYDLSTLYNNLKTINIKPTEGDRFHNPKAAAEYDVINNVILYAKEHHLTNIMHELLHVSTRRQNDDGETFVGFMQINRYGHVIGEGLNEGYTSLMNERYFSKYDTSEDKVSQKVYSNTKYICEIIEVLLGKDVVEKYYMNADLYNLYLDIGFYSDRYSVTRFIRLVDILQRESETKSIPNVPLILKTYSKIIYFLSECFLTKFKLMKNKGLLTSTEYIECIEYVKWLLDNNISYFKVIKSRKMSKNFNKLENMVDEKIKDRVK
jgi:hypothetical protein